MRMYIPRAMFTPESAPNERVVLAVLVLLVVVAAFIYRQRTLGPESGGGQKEGFAGYNATSGPPGAGTANFYNLSTSLGDLCDAGETSVDYDRAMLAPLVAHRETLTCDGEFCSSAGATPLAQIGRSSTGYTTPGWRPQWRPPRGSSATGSSLSGWAPVVSDDMGPAMGPTILNHHGEFDGAALSGGGAVTDAAYDTQVPTWIQRPAPGAGDFYSPEDGSARPVHELLGPGAVPMYNMLFEPGHDPLIGSGN